MCIFLLYHVSCFSSTPIFVPISTLFLILPIKGALFLVSLSLVFLSFPTFLSRLIFLFNSAFRGKISVLSFFLYAVSFSSWLVYHFIFTPSYYSQIYFVYTTFSFFSIHDKLISTMFSTR
jgi:hypothetical protein